MNEHIIPLHIQLTCVVILSLQMVKERLRVCACCVCETQKAVFKHPSVPEGTAAAKTLLSRDEKLQKVCTLPTWAFSGTEAD